MTIEDRLAKLEVESARTGAKLEGLTQTCGRIETSVEKMIDIVHKRINTRDEDLKQVKEELAGNSKKIYAIWFIGPVLIAVAAFISNLKNIFGN